MNGSVEWGAQRYTNFTGGNVEGRQRRRFTWPRTVVLALVLANSGAGWWLHQHNHLDIKAALVVVCMFVVTFVTGATLVLCRVVTRNHQLTRRHQEKVRRLEDEAPNVVPLRRNSVDEDTTVLPFVAVGRARAMVGGGIPAQPGRGLTFTAGDHTIDCALRDELEGGTG